MIPQSIFRKAQQISEARAILKKKFNDYETWTQ